MFQLTMLAFKPVQFFNCSPISMRSSDRPRTSPKRAIYDGIDNRTAINTEETKGARSLLRPSPEIGAKLRAAEMKEAEVRRKEIEARATANEVRRKKAETGEKQKRSRKETIHRRIVERARADTIVEELLNKSDRMPPFDDFIARLRECPELAKIEETRLKVLAEQVAQTWTQKEARRQEKKRKTTQLSEVQRRKSDNIINARGCDP